MAFHIYKSNQAKNTRLSVAIGVSVIACIGCYNLYNWLNGMEIGLSREQMLWFATLIPFAVLAIICGLAFWLVNKPSVADFMIVSEAELKKVNWSSKQEIYVSTVIVISVVVIMAVLLGLSDFVLEIFFRQIIFKA